MFATFFRELKQAGVPATPREYLTLMEAIEKDLAGRRIEEFYFAQRRFHRRCAVAYRRHLAVADRGRRLLPLRCQAPRGDRVICQTDPEAEPRQSTSRTACPGGVAIIVRMPAL